MINFTISGPSSLQTTSTSASTASYSAIGTTPQYAIPGWSWNIDSYSGDYDNFTYSLSETGVLYYAKKYSYTLYSKMIVTIKATSTYTSTVSKTYSVEITAAM
ncbi:hypothetical protein FACS1894166_04660 [Bacilli bacterium]|nr:hypothetical protein FACS1894166_04660 [Bacilli bacterium]